MQKRPETERTYVYNTIYMKLWTGQNNLEYWKCDQQFSGTGGGGTEKKGTWESFWSNGNVLSCSWGLYNHLHLPKLNKLYL